MFVPMIMGVCLPLLVRMLVSMRMCMSVVVRMGVMCVIVMLVAVVMVAELSRTFVEQHCPDPNDGYPRNCAQYRVKALRQDVLG
jgi:hypothetical protein